MAIQMWDAGVKIASNQIQYSLLDRRPELYMNEFCRLHGIGLLPYGVMAGGFLSDRYLNAEVIRTSRPNPYTASQTDYRGGAVCCASSGWCTPAGGGCYRCRGAA